LTKFHDADGRIRAHNPDNPAPPASQPPATRRRLYGGLRLSEERNRFRSADGYRIAILLPGAEAFLTNLSSRTPLSYVATDADSSSSAGSVKLR